MCHPKYQDSLGDEESDLETTNFFQNLQVVMELQEEFARIDEAHHQLLPPLRAVLFQDPMFDDVPMDSPMIIDPELPDPDLNISARMIQEFVHYMSYIIIDEVAQHSDLERVGQWADWGRLADHTILKLPFIPCTGQQEIALSIWFYNLPEKFGSLRHD